MLARAKTALVTHHHRRSSHRYSSTRSSHRLSSHRSCHQLIHKSSHRHLIGHLIRRLLLSHTPVTLPSPAAVIAIPHHISTSAFLTTFIIALSSHIFTVARIIIARAAFVDSFAVSAHVVVAVSRVACQHAYHRRSLTLPLFVPGFLNKIPPKRFTRFCSSYSLSLKIEHLRTHK